MSDNDSPQPDERTSQVHYPKITTFFKPKEIVKKPPIHREDLIGQGKKRRRNESDEDSENRRIHRSSNKKSRRFSTSDEEDVVIITSSNYHHDKEPLVTASSNLTDHQSSRPFIQQKTPIFCRYPENGLAKILHKNSSIEQRTTANIRSQKKFIKTIPKRQEHAGDTTPSLLDSDLDDDSVDDTHPPLIEIDKDDNLATSTKMPISVNEKQMHDVFFHQSYNSNRKLETILGLMNLKFSNRQQRIDISRLHIRELCRKVDKEHANYLALRLDKVGHGNFHAILNHSFFVVFQFQHNGETHYGVIDGNNRFAAVQKYNKTATVTQIKAIEVDYILAEEPIPSQAIIISTLASAEAEKDRLEYNSEEILRNGRLILNHQPEILQIQPPKETFDSVQKWQRKYEQIVREELSKILQVDPQKILSSIWRTVYIENEDYENMLPCVAKQCTSIIKLQNLCCVYKRRPKAIVELCTNADIINGTSDDFNKALNSIEGADWQYFLKKKRAYNYQKSDNENMRTIMGSTFEKLNEETRVNYLEAFLQWKGIENLRQYRNTGNMLHQIVKREVISNLIILLKKFKEWLLSDAPCLLKNKNNKEKKDEDGAESFEGDSAESVTYISSEEEDDQDEDATKRNFKKLKHSRRCSSENVEVKISMDSIQIDYLDHLHKYPHVASLFAHFVKTHSSNFEQLPESNPLVKFAKKFETKNHQFDWKAFNKAAAIGNNK